MVAQSENRGAIRTGQPVALPMWVKAVIVVCCLVQGAGIVADLMGWAILRQALNLLGGFWSVVFWSGQGLFPGQPLTMFATYGILHAGLLHLGMNMISLAALARDLNRLIGSRRMALVYAVSQVAAALLFAVMAPSGGPMIGASGAIFGLAGALVGFVAVASWRRGRPLGQLWRGVGLMVVLNVALTVMMPAIAWQAHLGGTLAGLVMGAVMARGNRRVSSRF